jgi:hypothetical protein
MIRRVENTSLTSTLECTHLDTSLRQQFTYLDKLSKHLPRALISTLHFVNTSLRQQFTYLDNCRSTYIEHLPRALTSTLTSILHFVTTSLRQNFIYSEVPCHAQPTMDLLDFPPEIILLIFESIPDQWALCGSPPIPGQEERDAFHRYSNIFSQDLWSLNSFVRTCKSLLNPTLYQWDAVFYHNCALRWASRYGNVATARLALQVRLPEEARHRRWEYLAAATVQCQEPIVRLLLEHGIDPNMIAYWDTTDFGAHQRGGISSLLEEATNLRCEPIVKLLLDHGAVADRPGFGRILARSAMAGDEGIVKLLLENRGGLPSIEPQEARAVFHAAIEGGSTSLVRFLLENGYFFESPDHSTITKAARHSDPELTKLLLAYGADPCPYYHPSGINVLPLAIAATLKHYEVAWLLRKSIDLEAMIQSGGQNQKCLLLIAAACGWDNLVRQRSKRLHSNPSEGGR